MKIWNVLVLFRDSWCKSTTVGLKVLMVALFHIKVRHMDTSHGASPMKKQQKMVIIGEKLCIINQLEKVKTFLIIPVY
jgi:hypothetical protein